MLFRWHRRCDVRASFPVWEALGFNSPDREAHHISKAETPGRLKLIRQCFLLVSRERSSVALTGLRSWRSRRTHDRLISVLARAARKMRTFTCANSAM